MSAQPLPKPEPDPAPERHEPSAADAEGWAMLEALRRRLDDQGALGRKTAVQVVELANSIGALVGEQRRRSKWANLNSFVAYVLFTVLVGAGFYMLYRSRAHELVEARDSAQRERDQAVKRADELTTKTTARDAADAKAWDIYQLLEAGKRTEAAGKLGSLADLPLSRTERAVLAARAHETQVMEVDAALKAAAASFKAGRYAEVVAPLEAALVSEPAGARASTMRYFLGVAYAKASQLDKAIALLTAAIGADVDQEDARFQLASALDRAGQYAKARTEYDRFATAHPQSQLAVFAMRRSATLARMPAVAPTAPAVVTSPTAPGVAPLKTPTPAPPKAVPTPATQPSAVPPPVKAPPTKTAPAKSLPTPAKPETPSPAATGSDAEPMSSLVVPRTAPKAEAPKTEPKPAPPAPAPKTEDPKPASPPSADRAPKLPPAPRAEPLPAFPIDRTPPPSPLGPPVDRPPPPSSPNAPRGEPQPPPLRF